MRPPVHPRVMARILRQIMADKEGILIDDASERLRHAARRYAKGFTA